MGMTIDEAIPILHDMYNYYNDVDVDAYVGFDNEDNNGIEIALETMRKYQKIETEILRWVEESGNYSDAHMLFIKQIIDGSDIDEYKRW